MPTIHGDPDLSLANRAFPPVLLGVPAAATIGWRARPAAPGTETRGMNDEQPDMGLSDEQLPLEDAAAPAGDNPAQA